MKHKDSQNNPAETNYSPRLQELNPTGECTLIIAGGLTEGVKTLDPVAHTLADAGFRVFSYDQVFGRENTPKDARNRFHMAKKRQLEEIMSIAQRDKDEKLTILGHSEGGIIAVGAAIDYPEMVDRVILFNSGGLFRDNLMRLAGGFGKELVRKTVTLKKEAQNQQLQGVKRMARHPLDYAGDAINISRSSITDEVRILENMGVKVDLVLSNKDKVFPYRRVESYLDDQSWFDQVDFNSVSMPYDIKPNGKPHLLAGKYAGHDHMIVYPQHTAGLVRQLVGRP